MNYKKIVISTIFVTGIFSQKNNAADSSTILDAANKFTQYKPLNPRQRQGLSDWLQRVLLLKMKEEEIGREQIELEADLERDLFLQKNIQARPVLEQQELLQKNVQTRSLLQQQQSKFRSLIKQEEQEMYIGLRLIQLLCLSTNTQERNANNSASAATSSNNRSSSAQGTEPSHRADQNDQRNRTQMTEQLRQQEALHQAARAAEEERRRNADSSLKLDYPFCCTRAHFNYR